MNFVHHQFQLPFLSSSMLLINDNSKEHLIKESMKIKIGLKMSGIKWDLSVNLSGSPKPQISP
jgi:hypothetical protein